MITFCILCSVLSVALSDSEVKFVKPDINLDGSKLENAFSVDSMELIQNLNREIDTDSKTKPSFTDSELLDIEKDEVVFSVLENSNSNAEQDYPHDRVMITDADLPSIIDKEENKTVGVVKNKTITVDCVLRSVNEDEVISVILANSTVLLKALTPNTTTNSSAGECTVVLFFSSQCVFSARMAPHYNALPRVFPGLYFCALDTTQHYSVHIRYGVVAVPSIILFQGGKTVARYNETVINLDNLVSFVTKYTNLQYNGTLNVTSADMNGPVPATLTKKVDFYLILAWVFTIFCICLWFLRSSLCHRIVECVKNTWREAEAQHEHED